MIDAIRNYVVDTVSGLAGCAGSVAGDVADFVAYRFDPNTKEERVASKQAFNKLRAYSKGNSSFGSGPSSNVALMPRGWFR